MIKLDVPPRDLGTDALIDVRPIFRSALVVLFLAASVTTGPLRAAPTENLQASASEEVHPWTAGDLDCAALDIDTTRMQNAFIVPAPQDPQRVLREAFPNGVPFAHLKQMLEIDPAGICHYREANRRLPANSGRRVVFLGDSITEIWGRADPNLFKADVIDRGISGQNTSQMLLRFQADVIALRPRVVHIMAGINDINTPAGTVLFRSNIESMVELAQANGIRVILGAITPSDSFWTAPRLKPAPQVRVLNDWLRAFAAGRGIPFIDYYAPLVDAAGGLRKNLSNDALHPNARGFALMSPLASAAVAAALSAPVMAPRGNR